MQDQIQLILKSVCRDLFHIDTDIELTRPEPKFGDFSTNIALKLSKHLSKSPQEIAETISQILNNQNNKLIEKVTIAGPGFINIILTNQSLHENYTNASNLEEFNEGQLILVEYGDPNPFKEMHAGHFYSAIEGDAIADLIESSGAEVKRLSYHGDVGLQVAKFIWGVGVAVEWDLDKVESAINAKSLGYYYGQGANDFNIDEITAKKIREINEHIYKKDNKLINDIYDIGWKISFEKFDYIFDQTGIKHDKRYLESESTNIGKEIVDSNIGKVFEESEGAIVYKGEKVGLHTRVFINSKNLPTYETKDLGLVELKNQDYPNATKSIIVTGNEQTEYFKVMLAALSEIDENLAKKTIHIAHGFLSLTTGKMASRVGNVYEAITLIEDVKKAIEKQYPDSEVKQDIFMAAIRYTFLRQRIGPDIIFSIKDSVGLEGNSGPYIQYAHARARSILKKSIDAGNSIAPELKTDQISLEPAERLLAMKISEFPEIVKRATEELMPHHICSYLYELSQEFNSFYESNRVLNDKRMYTRLHLVDIYAKVLKKGLKLLSIPAPEHM